MSLIPKIFCLRPPADAPHETIYFPKSNPVPLRAALARIAATDDRELLAEAICHYSGYVREAGIARCVEIGDPRFLAPIADRLNDWVPQVRKVAGDGLLTLLATTPAELFVPLLPKLRSLTQAMRTDHGPWLAKFEQRLVRAGGSAAISGALSSTDMRLRRAAFAVCLDHGLQSIVDLVRIGLASGDIVLARQAANLIDKVPHAEQQRCIELAMTSTFGPVRRAALRSILEQDDPAAMDFAKRALLDPQGSLRYSTARWLMQRGFDALRHCVDTLDSGRLRPGQIRAVLSLLGELQGKEALPVIGQHTQSAHVEVRAQALILMAKLAPSTKDDIAARAMQDPSRRVRRTAALLCVRHGAFVSLAQLRGMLEQYGDHITALRIAKREKWDYLVCIAFVGQLCEPDERTREDLASAIDIWLATEGSSWTRPSPAHMEVLAQPGMMTLLCNLANRSQALLVRRLLEVGVSA